MRRRTATDSGGGGGVGRPCQDRIIGKFGVGLRDAPEAFDRNHIGATLKSMHA